MQEIYQAIPQREPFLFVDKIIERRERSIHTQKKFSGDEDFFKGHFPGNPVTPGVILQEAVFQTGALLMSTIVADGRLGVVTKVENARFKHLVRPPTVLDIEVELIEQIENAFYMKGSIRVAGKAVMMIQFTCALV